MIWETYSVIFFWDEDLTTKPNLYATINVLLRESDVNIKVIT